MSSYFTAGSDVEVFLINKKSDIVSAVGLIGGTKAEPKPVPRGAVQEDNVTAEFNIVPAKSSSEFVENLTTVLNELNKIASNHGLTYHVKDVYEFSAKELDNPQAQTFGCDPDYNLYTNSQNPPVDREAIGNIRVAGGHVHFGFDNPEEHPLLRIRTIQWADILIGLPLAYIEPASIRRNFYGKAGSFRWKEYGVEYRTPSNFWITNRKLMEWMFKQMKNAADHAILAHDPLRFIRGYDPDDVVNAINLSGKDKRIAADLMGKYGLSTPSL